MARQNPRSHIKFEGFSSSLPYTYPRNNFPPAAGVRERNRNMHGSRLLQQLQNIRDRFDLPNDLTLPDGIVRDDATYVDFISEWGFPLKFDSLDQDTDRPNYQILNIREEIGEINEQQVYRYHVTMMMTPGGVSKFITKVRDYLEKNIVRNGVDTGNPRNYALLNNIDIIQIATLQSFWTDDPEIRFPDEQEDVWWEAWFRKTPNDQFRIRRVLENLEAVGAQVGAAELEFAEHRVRLIKGSGNQLSQSLLLLDNLAELRKPQETADFIFHRDDDYLAQAEWLNDLIDRTDAEFDENSILICLLDSGVNNGHPLIAPFLPDERLYSYKPEAWGTNDGWPNGGHGTGVAGLAIYGDLIDALANPFRVRVLHGLESFKMIHANDANDPELYGAITELAVSTPIVDLPNQLRVFCLTITDEQQAFKGRPSAWSAAIDKIAFGSFLEPKFPQLMVLSSGNVYINNHGEFPANNYLESIHDPGQAYNAITVGSYTRKDRIAPQTGYRHLAPNGSMAPSNSTSTLWDHQWPIKPDIVMEGGNSATNGIHVVDHTDLKMLSLDSEYPRFTFIPFGDTSGAAGLAAKFAADLRAAYPNYWPETIRGLMIHSAEWTSVMLGNRQIGMLSEQDRKNLLRSVGYGVPILENALYSANNSLTLIAERELQPYILDGSATRTNEYHLFELPWPTDVLENDLFEQNVTLTVTLSYFIEPNPGSRNKKYATNFHYHSHNLDFAVIKRDENLDVFKRRISAASDQPDEDVNNSDEPWIIKRVRSRGSIKKDFITMSGVDMSRRNYLAIYPKAGWYRTRKKLNKVNEIVRYSLIVTIETPNVNIDLYTPVANLIANAIAINV
jgi:hypothetical protein